MPASYAHKKFGAEVFQALDGDTRRLIRQHLPYYLIGLHGPDILFFHYPDASGSLAAYARVLHHSPFAGFLTHAKEVLKRQPDDEKLVYLYGVLCHLHLDAFCHPYVEWAAERYGVTHGKLEMELERFLLEQDGFRPLTFPTTAHIGISRQYARHIAPFYEGVTEREILECLLGYRLVSTATRRSDSLSRKLVCRLMSAKGWEHKVASVVMSKQPSSLCKPAVKELMRRFAAAQEPAREAVGRLSRALFSDGLPEYASYTFYETTCGGTYDIYGNTESGH